MDFQLFLILLRFFKNPLEEEEEEEEDA